MAALTAKFQSKPFFVDAVRVTDANFDEVVKWCTGDVGASDSLSEPQKKYIRVRVNNPIQTRHTRAFVGDWILYSDHYGYKVYNDWAFNKIFALAEDQLEAPEDEGMATERQQ